jgi:hypothetical protein
MRRGHLDAIIHPYFSLKYWKLTYISTHKSKGPMNRDGRGTVNQNLLALLSRDGLKCMSRTFFVFYHTYELQNLRNWQKNVYFSHIKVTSLWEVTRRKLLCYTRSSEFTKSLALPSRDGRGAVNQNLLALPSSDDRSNTNFWRREVISLSHNATTYKLY